MVALIVVCSEGYCARAGAASSGSPGGTWCPRLEFHVFSARWRATHTLAVVALDRVHPARTRPMATLRNVHLVRRPRARSARHVIASTPDGRSVRRRPTLLK